MPSQAEPYQQLGYIAKAHGLKGEVKIKLTATPGVAVFVSGNFLFLDISSPPVPYLINKAKAAAPDLVIVQFEDVRTKEAADLLVGKTVAVPADQLEDHEEDELAWEDLVGFEMIDAVSGSLGKINDVLVMPNQFIAQLFVQGKEVLIPMNEESVEAVDEAEQKVFTRIPEGLVELYLEED